MALSKESPSLLALYLCLYPADEDFGAPILKQMFRIGRITLEPLDMSFYDGVRPLALWSFGTRKYRHTKAQAQKQERIRLGEAASRENARCVEDLRRDVAG
jgi:hypothetical protein